MSRGPGIKQRMVWDVIVSHGKPLTFTEICAQIVREVGVEPDIKLRPSFQRSTRLALHRLTKKGVMIAISDGRGEPFRYFLHPMVVDMMAADQSKFDILFKALDADAGENAAAIKAM